MEHKNNSGFTLVELVVVMVIVGILASLAIPGYRKYVGQSRSREGVSLVGAVAQAQRFHYDDLGVFKAIPAGTSNDTGLGVDARGNTYFKTFGVTVSGYGESAQFVVTAPGTDAASSITVTATGGVTFATQIDEGLTNFE